MVRYCEDCGVLTDSLNGVCSPCMYAREQGRVKLTKEDERELRSIGPRGWGRSRSYVKVSQRCLAPRRITRDEE